jgi:hypothetical protein
LEFTICDKGVVGSKTEGKAVLSSEYFYPDGFEGDVPIDGLEHASLYVRIYPVDHLKHGSHDLQRHQSPARAVAHAPVSLNSATARAEGPPQTLQVRMIQATGLAHLNFAGLNCYCVCSAWHADQQDSHAKCQTKPISNLDPIWNEAHEIDPWHVDESLEFTIYDEGARQQARAVLPHDHFYPNGFDGALPIEGLQHVVLHVSVSSLGRATQASLAPPREGDAHTLDCEWMFGDCATGRLLEKREQMLVAMVP